MPWTIPPPDPNDVVAGWGPLIGLILMFVAGVGLFFALRSQLRRVSASNLPSIHDDEDADAPTGDAQAAKQRTDRQQPSLATMEAPAEVDLKAPQSAKGRVKDRHDHETDHETGGGK